MCVGQWQRSCIATGISGQVLALAGQFGLEPGFLVTKMIFLAQHANRPRFCPLNFTSSKASAEQVADLLHFQRPAARLDF